MNTIINKKKYNTIDLFCGCGGFSYGLEKSGLNIIGSVDIWDKAIESYKINMPNHKALCKDLTKYTPQEFHNEIGLDNNIDILIGSPPCFIEGTRILTNNGYKNIESVDLSDKLLTHNGIFQDILNLQRKIYSGDLYEIKIKYHPEKIICTEEHPFYVRSMIKKWDNTIRRYKYIKGEPEWKMAKDITMDDYFSMVINNNEIIPEFEFDRKVNQNTIVKEKIKLDNLDYWYMMGYFVGDGWIIEHKKNYPINFVINDNDENEVVEKIKKVLPINIKKEKKLGKCKKYVCCNLIWYSLLQKFGKYAHGKLIPEWVQDAPKEYIKEFVKGYIKADGNKKDNIYKITTVSSDLAYGLQRLFLKLGHIACVKKTIRPKTRVIQGRLVNQRDTFEILVYNYNNHEFDNNQNQREQSSFIEDKYVWFRPAMIEKKYTENTQVYNFEVDIDNSYIVQNTIVHNCQAFSMAGKRDKNDPRNSLFIEYVKYLDYFKPKAFLMENVIGMLSAKLANNEKAIDVIMNELSKNYNVTYYKLYASDFGVPQNRRRVIIIGFRKDLNIIPTEPIKKIENENDRPSVKSILELKENIDKKQYLSQKALDGIKLKKEKMKEKGYGFGAQFLDFDKPSYTISCRYWKDGYEALVKYNENEVRRLTILELKRIQSFPDNYILCGSKKEQTMQIGNAVACNFAKELGLYIQDKLNNN